MFSGHRYQSIINHSRSNFMFSYIYGFLWQTPRTRFLKLAYPLLKSQFCSSSLMMGVSCQCTVNWSNLKYYKECNHFIDVVIYLCLWGIVRESGSIRKCFDEFYEEFVISDELRKVSLFWMNAFIRIILSWVLSKIGRLEFSPTWNILTTIFNMVVRIWHSYGPFCLG